MHLELIPSPIHQTMKCILRESLFLSLITNDPDIIDFALEFSQPTTANQ